jgi:hypothetical protein
MKYSKQTYENNSKAKNKNENDKNIINYHLEDKSK